MSALYFLIAVIFAMVSFAFFKSSFAMLLKIKYARFMHKKFGTHYVLIDDIYQNTHLARMILVPSGILINHPDFGWKSIVRLAKYSVVGLTVNKNELNTAVRLLRENSVVI